MANLSTASCTTAGQQLQNGDIVMLRAEQNPSLYIHADSNGELYTGAAPPVGAAPEEYAFEVFKQAVQRSGGTSHPSAVFEGDNIALRSLATGRFLHGGACACGGSAFKATLGYDTVHFHYENEANASLGSFTLLSRGAVANPLVGAAPVLKGSTAYAVHHTGKSCFLSASTTHGVNSAGSANSSEFFVLQDTGRGQARPAVVTPASDNINHGLASILPSASDAYGSGVYSGRCSNLNSNIPTAAAGAALGCSAVRASTYADDACCATSAAQGAATGWIILLIILVIFIALAVVVVAARRKGVAPHQVLFGSTVQRRQ